jgi:aspartate/methionine/tyrosine aminotransferase
VAALYEGAMPDNVLVTVGASEANYIIANTLLESGDEVAVMRSTYMQLSGAAANLGANVRSFSLDGTRDWELDLDELKDAVTPKTKVISIVNPNNPTGKILSDIEMNAIITTAEKVGAWLVTDEVYGGSERNIYQPETSFFGKYDKVIGVNGLSKAYGLPGLRIGWVVAPTFITKELWKRHEFITISSSMLGNRLGEMALRLNVREKLLTRAQKLASEGFTTLQYFFGRVPRCIFSCAPYGFCTFICSLQTSY